MASNVDDKIFFSIYGEVYGTVNPTQATQCVARHEPFGRMEGI